MHIATIRSNDAELHFEHRCKTPHKVWSKWQPRSTHTALRSSFHDSGTFTRQSSCRCSPSSAEPGPAPTPEPCTHLWSSQAVHCSQDPGPGIPCGVPSAQLTTGGRARRRRAPDPQADTARQSRARPSSSGTSSGCNGASLSVVWGRLCTGGSPSSARHGACPRAAGRIPGCSTFLPPPLHTSFAHHEADPLLLGHAYVGLPPSAAAGAAVDGDPAFLAVDVAGVPEQRQARAARLALAPGDHLALLHPVVMLGSVAAGSGRRSVGASAVGALRSPHPAAVHAVQPPTGSCRTPRRRSRCPPAGQRRCVFGASAGTTTGPGIPRGVPSAPAAARAGVVGTSAGPASR
eukprot:gene481-biopygen7616